MCAYLNYQLASVFTSNGCNCIFRRMMVGGGGRKRKLADYDPYEGAFSDDSEYEVIKPIPCSFSSFDMVYMNL